VCIGLVTDPPSKCTDDDDAGDVAFVRATSSIGGRDAVEEYLAYGLFPLSVGLALEKSSMEKQ
jgi:hypothetical protein